MDILISIIVPNYNHYKFLQKRLDSIFNQTIKNFEVIILDDASTDNSLYLLKEFEKHPKVSHFILNQFNGGSPFLQWKKGIELAQGKYIWIAESDDFSEFTFLEKTVSMLEKNNNICLAFSNSIIQNLISETNSVLTNHKRTGVYNNLSENFLFDWFFNQNSFRITNASSCVFRRCCINENVILQLQNYRYAGDKLFWSSLILKFPEFGFIEEPLNTHTFHENTSRSKITKQTNFLRNKEVLSIYNFCKFNVNKNFNIGWRREYGSRLLLSFLFNLLLFKKLKLKDLFFGLKIVKFDLEVYKKLYRAAMLPK